jgi:hypothetical protein
MHRVPRLLLLLLLASTAIAAACSTAGQPSPAATPPRRSTARPVAGTPQFSRGAIQLSGAVDGFLSVLSVSCVSSGPNVLVAIRGRVENALYGVEVSALRNGTFEVGAEASVRLRSQTPADAAVSRWSAGDGSAGGSGGVSLSPAGGSIDVDLVGSSGAAGSVHLRGSWSCPV